MTGQHNGDAFPAACLQMRSGVSQDANIAELRRLVAEASSQGARYIQSPEMTGIVQRNRQALLREIDFDADNPVFAAASELARDHGIWLHVGSTAIRLAENRAANRGALFSPRGDRVAIYDKIHMFDVDLDNGESWRESSLYEAGSRAVIAHGPSLPIGMAICYDLRFPALFRHLAKGGAGLLTAPSCFTRQTGLAHWHVLTRARAIENGSYVVAAAQGGLHDDGRETYGHSLIVDPWGEIVAEMDGDEPGVLLGRIEPGRVAAARAKIPSIKHERAFALAQTSFPRDTGDADQQKDTVA